MDYLGLTENEVNWFYSVRGVNNKARTLYLDGRIPFEAIRNLEAKKRIIHWKHNIAALLELTTDVEKAMSGIVFEVRQGYKSKDSKRQNADISNASNAYANGYIPCLMVMSSQIDDDIVIRYQQAKWSILRGKLGQSEYESTYLFFKDIIGFDLAGFMSTNQKYFQSEIQQILTMLVRAE